MLKRNEQGDSLLSARLSSDRRHKQAPPASTIEALKKKVAARENIQPPIYGADQETTHQSHGAPLGYTTPKQGKRKTTEESTKKRLKRATQTLQDTDTDHDWDERPMDPWDYASHEHGDLDMMPDPATYDQVLEQESLESVQRGEKMRRIKRGCSQVITVLLVILSVYLTFLIYGVSQTNYIYDNNGQIQPEILSTEDKAILAEYESLSQYYLRERILYEKTLSLDYRLSLEPDNALTIAMEYQGLLEEVAKLTVDINAADFSTAYEGVKAQLLTWVKTDIAVYLQNMSGALTNNDGDKAQKALISRDVMYNDFQTITSNLANLCHNTKGARNGNIFTWSPEAFVASLQEEGE